MRHIAFVVASLTLTSACGGASAPDQSTPEGTLQAVFDAAKSGDDQFLALLCNATAGGDGDTKRICAVKKDAPEWGKFVAAFKDGKIGGGASVDGDEAKVPFKFGPGGQEDEKMRLKRVDGKWYLGSF